MSTADRLLHDLRALLAEFRSPEHRDWLTSACADRLESVLTEHAPPEVGSCANQLAGLMKQDVPGCLDCGLPYEQFPIDVILPRAQWLEIHPDEHGLLCAACIVTRAAKVSRATACHLIIEIAATVRGAAVE
jgi:hypothetical protein